MKFKKGDVIKTYMSNLTPPKEKYLIFLGNTKDQSLFAYVYINTGINFSVNGTQEKLDLQYPLGKYPFLSHGESFVNCASIHNYSYKIFVDNMIKNSGKIVGRISDIDLGKIVNLIKTTPNTPAKYKTEYNI